MRDQLRAVGCTPGQALEICITDKARIHLEGRRNSFHVCTQWLTARNENFVLHFFDSDCL